MHRQAMLRATYYPAGDGYGYAPGYYAAGGFLSGLKKAVKAGTKIASGFATGGVAGAALAGASLLASKPKTTALAPMTGVVVGQKTLGTFSGGGGGGGFSTKMGMVGGSVAGLTRGEQAGKRPRAINPRTGKPYRHMNPFNFKALRRADRRMHRFAKAVRHFVTVTKTGHAGVKIRKRRRS